MVPVLGRLSSKQELKLQRNPPMVLVGTPQPLASILRAHGMPLADPRNRLLVLDEVDSLAADYRWPHLAHILATKREGNSRLVSQNPPSTLVMAMLPDTSTCRERLQ